jgi:hypothetical protein
LSGGKGRAHCPTIFRSPPQDGDLVTALLALLALFALQRNSRRALLFVWTCYIVGAIDRITALRHLDIAPLCAVAWYVATFLVPLLLDSHVLIFA